MKKLRLLIPLFLLGMLSCETENGITPNLTTPNSTADQGDKNCTTCEIFNSNGWAGVQVFPNGRIQGEPMIRYFMDPEPETMEFCDDGTAHFMITAVNADDENDAWLYDVWINNGIPYEDWIAQENHFIKLGGGIPEELTETWTIYLVDPASTATGLADNAGRILPVVHDPEDERFGIQVGEGANGRNTGFGLWGWYALIDEDGNRIPADWIFDVNCPPPPPGDGCTHTIGFWKTHAGLKKQDDVVSQYLPINLGNEGGSKSLTVTTNVMAVDILKMKKYGHNSNGITKLYAQLLGAKLSIADGADGGPVSDVINAADDFLAENDYTDWESADNKEEILGWKTSLDNYNNGLSGVLHCDDAEDND